MSKDVTEFDAQDWIDLRDRLDKAIGLRWYATKGNYEGVVKWMCDLDLTFRQAHSMPFSHEVHTRHHDPYLLAQMFSELPPKVAYKAIRSIAVPTVDEGETEAFLAETQCRSVLATFGDTLLQAAETALPIDAKMDAQRFKRATTRSERFTILKRAVSSLRCSTWVARHPLIAKADREPRGDHDGNHVTYDYSPWMVLPHVHGTFPESPMRPNCMGISFLVGAWCRLADLSFTHCRLIEDFTNHHWHIYGNVLQEAMAYCELEGIELELGMLNWMQKDAEVADSMGLDTHAGSLSEGHAFICAELEPDKWFVLDPWMDNWYAVENSDNSTDNPGYATLSPGDAFKVLTEQKFVHPGMTLLGTDQQHNRHWVNVREQLQHELYIAMVKTQTYRQLLADEAHSFTDLVLILARVLLQIEMPEGYTDDALNWRMSGYDNPRDSSEDAVLLRMADQLLYELRDFYAGVHDVTMSEADRIMRRVMKSYESDPRLAERVRCDLFTMGIRKVLTGCMSIATETKSTDLNTLAHVTIEYGTNTTNVALGAFVHLMAWDEEIKEILRPTDLLRLSTSQLVWQEAVTALHYRYAQARWSQQVAKHEMMRWVAEKGGPSPIDQAADELLPPWPPFGELVLSDRQDWVDLLGSSGADWLLPSDLALVRETTRQMLLIKPSQQHRQVRRLLLRLQQEHEWSQQANQTAQPQEASHGKE